MTIKPTIQGALIYAAMAAYATALALTLARRRRHGLTLFAVGFGVTMAAFAYRWIHVAHWPMQNLFEVFITMGMLSYPVSMLSRRYLKIGGHGWDMAIGLVLLFPAGFVFQAEPQQLPPALQSPLFAPHVAVYMISYVLMFKAFLSAVMQLTNRVGTPLPCLTAAGTTLGALLGIVLAVFIHNPMETILVCMSGGSIVGLLLGRVVQVSREPDILEPEQAAYTMISLGFPLLTLGLLLGSVWGQYAWGDFWGWDPKELWSLASWLAYVGYFHFRYMFGTRYARVNSAWAILGTVFIIITLLWVNLSSLFPGLHNYAQ